ncbi:MAG: Fur family transcriptional regulator [Mycobacteriaceae bacterium]|jgi:Fur family ferric uptake transcriptional regulator
MVFNSRSVGPADDDATADVGLRSAVAGVRATRQRAAIIALLENVDGFRSAQELHDELRHSGATIGLTTVYRTLQALAAADLVDMVRTDTGESVYRRCTAPHHHHHLVCRDCGAAVEVSGLEVEAWAAEVAADHGFSDVSHTIELFGTCADCHSR